MDSEQKFGAGGALGQGSRKNTSSASTGTHRALQEEAEGVLHLHHEIVRMKGLFGEILDIFEKDALAEVEMSWLEDLAQRGLYGEEG